MADEINIAQQMFARGNSVQTKQQGGAFYAAQHGGAWLSGGVNVADSLIPLQHAALIKMDSKMIKWMK